MDRECWLGGVGKLICYRVIFEKSSKEVKGRNTFSYDYGWGRVVQAEGTLSAEALRPGQSQAKEPVVAGVGKGESSSVPGNMD